jgi:hypothetical protein
MEHLKLFEEFKDKVTYEMSGPPPRHLWRYKADFTDDMSSWGYEHTSLTKKTDMLMVEDENLETAKTKKAKKYNIPIHSYKDAFKKKDKLYTITMRKKRMGDIMSKLGEK